MEPRYNGEERRSERRANELDTHFEITQQNVRDIGTMKSDIAGLKVGQDALGEQTKSGFDNTSDKFDHLSRQLTELAAPKPPIAIIPLMTLAMVVLGSFGTVMVFLSSQAATSMQREADMRIQHITERFLLAEQKDDNRHSMEASADNEAMTQQQEAFLTFVANIQTKFADDDIREQKDAYDKGFAAAKFNDLSNRFDTVVNELHILNRRNEDWKIDIVDRLSMTQTGLRASGKYMQEHVNKQGSQGHPVPERHISREATVNGP